MSPCTSFATTMQSSRQRCRLLLVGMLVACFVPCSSAAHGQTKLSPRAAQWTVTYQDGTETLDPKTTLLLTFEKEMITASSGREIAFSVRIADISMAVHGVQAKEFFSGAEEPFFILLNALTSRLEQVVTLFWEEDGIRSWAFLTLRNEDTKPFLAELRTLLGQEKVIEDRREDPLDREAPNLPPRPELHPRPKAEPHPQPEKSQEAPAKPFRSLESRNLGMPHTFQAIKMFEAERAAFHDDGVFFDWEPDFLFQFKDRTVERIDWRKKTTVSSRILTDLPCPHDGDRMGTHSQHYWWVVPRGSELLVHRCSALFLVDKATLTVRRRLVKTGNFAFSATSLFWAHPNKQVQFSPTGELAAVPVLTHRLPAHRLVIFDTRSWEAVARLSVADVGSFYPTVAFNSDGSLLVVLTGDKRKGVPCTIQTYRMPSGTLATEFRDSFCGDTITPVPGRPDLMGWNGLALWDISTGQVMQRVTYEDKEPCGPLWFSPDWKWAIHSVSARHVTPGYVIEFVIRDPLTGAIFSANPGKKPSNYTGCGPEILGVSRDGKYVLLADSRFTLYEVVAKN